MKRLIQLVTRTLTGRMLLSFIACASVLWLVLLVWGIYSAIQGGRDEVRLESQIYARQVMAAASSMTENHKGLAKAMAQVQAIEREPDREGDEPDNMYIQVWHKGQEVTQTAALPSTLPSKSGFHDLTIDDVTWWTYTQTNSEHDMVVRVAGEAGSVAALSDNNLVVFFIPLLVSLPILLIPAWLMTRFGLKPLRETTEQIGERVQSGVLNPLPESKYRELNQVVGATNRLMSRLDLQLKRERGFVAEVAHEMKTPLAIIQTNLGTLTDSQNPERRATALNDLKAGVKRSDHLIAQLLRMARLDNELDATAQQRRSDLAEFVRQRVAQISPLASKRNIRIELDAPETYVIDIDLDAVAAVLDNLLDNAIKYSPPDSLIQVSMQAESAQNQFVLEVRDQGDGIEPADRPAAFEAFKRLNIDNESTGSYQPSGAGLGLSIVARAADRLGGQIELLAQTNRSGLLARLSVPVQTQLQHR
jgi:two-component system sensor histidine kinase QseC